MDGLVDEQGYDQRVEHGDDRRLGGGEEAGVDAAQHDDGAQQRPEALLEQGPQAVAAQLSHSLVDQLAVLAFPAAVEHGVDHHEQADEDAGEDAAQKQRAGGNAGSQRVQDEGDGRRDDDAQAAGHGDQARAPFALIAQSHHEGDAHGAHRRGGGGTGTGDGAVEQAGQDDRAGHAAGKTPDEVGEEVEQLLGDAALRHDDAAQDEQGHGQDGGGVGAGEGVVEHLHDGAAGAHHQDGGDGAQHHGDADGDGNGDADQEYYEYQ